MSSSANGMSEAAEGQAPSPTTEEHVFSLSAAEGRALFDAVKANKALLTLPHPLLKKMLSQYDELATDAITDEINHHLNVEISTFGDGYVFDDFTRLNHDVSFLIDLPDNGPRRAALLVLDFFGTMEQEIGEYDDNMTLWEDHCEIIDRLVLKAVQAMSPLSAKEAYELHDRLAEERRYSDGYYANFHYTKSYHFAKVVVESYRREVARLLVFRAIGDRLPAELSELIVDQYMLQVFATPEIGREPRSASPDVFWYGCT